MISADDRDFIRARFSDIRLDRRDLHHLHTVSYSSPRVFPALSSVERIILILRIYRITWPEIKAFMNLNVCPRTLRNWMIDTKEYRLLLDYREK